MKIPKAKTEEENKIIIDVVLTECGKHLKLAALLTDSNHFIKGTCCYPDGSIWTLEFKKVVQ